MHTSTTNLQYPPTYCRPGSSDSYLAIVCQVVAIVTLSDAATSGGAGSPPGVCCSSNCTVTP